MESVPADIGNWGLVRVFQEGGRLLTKHFGVFLPVILLCILPASLIKVLHTQFFVADFVGHQGSTVPESRSFLAVFSLSLLFGLPLLLILLGAFVMFDFLMNMVYVSDCKTGPCRTESLLRSVKSALLFTKVETENPALRTTATEKQLFNLFWRLSNGKRLRASAVTIACVVGYVVISTSGINFTPEAVAAMGLPPWSIFLFTLFIVLLTTLSTSYLLLANLVLFIWIMSPKLPFLG